MTYHLITHEGSTPVGPSDYEREDQEVARALFLDVHDAFSRVPTTRSAWWTT